MIPLQRTDEVLAVLAVLGLLAGLVTFEFRLWYLEWRQRRFADRAIGRYDQMVDTLTRSHQEANRLVMAALTSARGQERRFVIVGDQEGEVCIHGLVLVPPEQGFQEVHDEVSEHYARAKADDPETWNYGEVLDSLEHQGFTVYRDIEMWWE